MNANCDYCLMQTDHQVGTSEIPVYLCEKCELLLKDPEFAMRLIRGHLSMKLRGTNSEEELEKLINNGIEALQNFKAQQ